MTLAVRGLTTVILLYLLQIAFVKILQARVLSHKTNYVRASILIINVTFVHNSLTHQDKTIHDLKLSL
jgi:hypothetical protein